MDKAIVIRRASTPEDYRACQEAQRKAWGITEDGYVVPVATMVAAQLHGGIVLGAFLPSGEAVGLSFGFLGRIEGRLGLYSQLTGVVPGYQDHGIGGRMKELQRQIAHDEGLAVIGWAFDPLQAGNARFNLDKLGATSGHYIPNMYGPRTDALNAGTPTDRLLVVWETDPAKRSPTPAVDPTAIPALIQTERDPNGLRRPLSVRGIAGEPQLLLEIPLEIGTLRQADARLADAWRMHVREAFLAAFAHGYRAVGFLRFEPEGEKRGGYVLKRMP